MDDASPVLDNILAAKKVIEKAETDALRMMYFSDSGLEEKVKPWVAKLESATKILLAFIQEKYRLHAAQWKAHLLDRQQIMHSAMDSALLKEFTTLVKADLTQTALSRLLAIAQDPMSREVYQAYKSWDMCRRELVDLAKDADADIDLEGVDEMKAATKLVASMTIVQALERPLKQNESRTSLAKKCRAMINEKEWVRLPAKLDMLLSKTHGDLGAGTPGSAPSAGASSEFA